MMMLRYEVMNNTANVMKLTFLVETALAALMNNE